MSGCNRYNLGDTPGGITVVVKTIAYEILKDYEYCYLFGSRLRGGWRYCSDFDFAVPEQDTHVIRQKAQELSMKCGVSVELRNSYFFEMNNFGLKISRNE